MEIENITATPESLGEPPFVDAVEAERLIIQARQRSMQRVWDAMPDEDEF
jgi:hypothetical protein